MPIVRVMRDLCAAVEYQVDFTSLSSYSFRHKWRSDLSARKAARSQKRVSADADFTAVIMFIDWIDRPSAPALAPAHAHLSIRRLCPSHGGITTRWASY